MDLHTFTAQHGDETWELRWQLPTMLDLLSQGTALLPIPAALADYLDRSPKANIPIDPESEYGIAKQFRQLAREGEANARGAVRAEAAALVAAVRELRVSSPADPSPGWVPCRLVRRVEDHDPDGAPYRLFFGHVPSAVRRGLAGAIRDAAQEGVPPEMIQALLDNPYLAAKIARASRLYGGGKPTAALAWGPLDWVLHLIDGKVTRDEVEAIEAALSQRNVPIFPGFLLGIVGAY